METLPIMLLEKDQSDHSKHVLDVEKTVAGRYTMGGSRPNDELQSEKQRGNLFVRSQPRPKKFFIVVERRIWQIREKKERGEVASGLGKLDGDWRNIGC